MDTPTYLTSIGNVTQLSSADKEQLSGVIDKFAFRSNTYYQSLIDWSDPNDPIRQIIMPNTVELSSWGRLDASNEGSYTVVPGVEHKYPSTALLLVTDVCGGYCRFCFRKRLFMPENDEVASNISPGIEYIRLHPEISNVLLTGGDPLILSTRRLADIFSQLAMIEHVRIIRVGSKMPAFNPARILNDRSLFEMIRAYSSKKCIYLMTHFNHPRELTPEAIQALSYLRSAGVIAVNQTPIIRGVNDRPDVLIQLFNTLSYIGVPPYYVFQCRPTAGNEGYIVPIEESYNVLSDAQKNCSGLAKRARFVMSHTTGKIEVVGLSADSIFMRYHEAVSSQDANRMLIFKSNPVARWLDDYEESSKEISNQNWNGEKNHCLQV